MLVSDDTGGLLSYSATVKELLPPSRRITISNIAPQNRRRAQQGMGTFTFNQRSTSCPIHIEE